MAKPGRTRKISVQASSYENSNDYTKKRQRNNLAVKKCREKSNGEVKQTKERVEKLKRENIKLEGTIEELKKNIRVLNELLERSDLSIENRIRVQNLLKDFQN